MIIGVDIETRGLDATKYITGSLWIENRKKPEIYRSKKKLWKRIIQLGKAQAKRKKVLNIYMHNAQFDTAGYLDFKDKNMIYFCDRPFIWAYKQNKNEMDKLGVPIKKAYKEIIKFLDTKNIYGRMTLKQLGELIKHPKQEYNMDEIETKEFSEQDLLELETYCANDALICVKAIHYIRKKIAEEGITIKRLYTINQIARQYLFNQWLKLDDKYIEPYFWNKKKGEARRTFRAKEIHASYRGGRCEAWRTGIIGKVDYYDVGSLYPYAITQMKTPNLKSERMIKYQQEDESRVKEYTHWKLPQIGIARVLMKNESNEIGLLQIRTSKDNYYPTTGKIFIGTYTHEELQLAIKEGYKILDVEWTVTYDEAPNPFKHIMPKIYKKRMQAKNEFDNWFYKMMMNASIGKMAQHRTGQEMVVDNIEEAQEYLKKNYEMVHGMNDQIMFKNTNVEKDTKPYYMPIQVSLCTAWSRCYMYKWFKKIGLKDLIYTDTDSAIVPHGTKVELPIGTEMGMFKPEMTCVDATIYGRKTYSIGNEIKVAGIKKRGIEKVDFDKGEIKSLKQITKNTAIDYKDIGKFITEERDLNKQLNDLKTRKRLLAKEELLIDYDIEDINHFIPKISQII